MRLKLTVDVESVGTAVSNGSPFRHDLRRARLGRRVVREHEGASHAPNGFESRLEVRVAHHANIPSRDGLAGMDGGVRSHVVVRRGSEVVGVAESTHTRGFESRRS